MSNIKAVVGMSICVALYIGCDWLIKSNQNVVLERQKDKAKRMIKEIADAFKGGNKSVDVKDILNHMKPLMVATRRQLTDVDYIRYTAAVRIMAAEELA